MPLHPCEPRCKVICVRASAWKMLKGADTRQFTKASAAQPQVSCPVQGPPSLFVPLPPWSHRSIPDPMVVLRVFFPQNEPRTDRGSGWGVLWQDWKLGPSSHHPGHSLTQGTPPAFPLNTLQEERAATGKSELLVPTLGQILHPN